MSSDGPVRPGLRARNRAAVEREVLRAGRRQLGEVGAAALSVRAVARELGMVSSAIYRYVANRDDLLTLLIVAAYDDLGDAVDAALDGRPDAPPRTRFTVLCTAVREWALAHPHDYALLYGSPVPHYHAPAERTTGPGTRVQVRLLDLLAEVPEPRSDGTDDAVLAAAAALGPTLDDPVFTGRPVPAPVLVRGLAAWSLVLGALGAEVFEQLGRDTLRDPATHFAAMVALAADLVWAA